MTARTCTIETWKKKHPNHIGHGTFKRTSDGQIVPRFYCKDCGKTSSNATDSLEIYQKKRHLNFPIAKDYAMNQGINDIARKYKISPNTVKNKIIFCHNLAKAENQALLEELRNINQFQLDELLTFEHTKLKPIHIALAVENKTRYILGAVASPAPYSGPLANFALQKYGPRIDLRREGMIQLLGSICPYVSENAIIDSDLCSWYPRAIKEVFPDAKHLKYKGRKPRRYGLDELKTGPFDPLFSINHTSAMFRAHVNRLFRKTWCTTKLLARLQIHIDLYIMFHNRRIKELLEKKAQKQIKAS